MGRIIVIILIFCSNLAAQKTTYSKYESDMINFANNGWAYAVKYDSLEIAKATLDSCRKFITQYPNTFAKLNVLSFMLEMESIFSEDKNSIFELADSVLFYDHSPQTMLRIGEILIERNFDIEKGQEYVRNALPRLSEPIHKYRAYMVLARSDISQGNYTWAETNYKNALVFEPERLSAWYEYLGLAKMSEQSSSEKLIEATINKLEQKEKKVFSDESTTGPNINKSILKLELPDLDGKTVKLGNYSGKVILINRFNFWCGWCLKEFPLLRKIINEFPDVEIIFINSGEKPEELRNYYFKKPEYQFLENQVILYTNKQYFDEIYGHKVPQTMLIDKKGRIRFDYTGYKENMESLLRKNLSKLLKE